MSIYDLDAKQLKSEMKAFGGTRYGKIVFCIAYSPFFLTLVIAIALFFVLKGSVYSFLSVALPLGLLLCSLFAFCIGSGYFYNQFKGFIKNKKVESVRDDRYDE